jgi:hypothetical protein
VSNPLEEFRDKERIRLIEADLALTNEFIRGVVTTGAAIRGVAVTIWLAMLGLAVQQSMAPLAVIAMLVAITFWLIDGYYGWLYREASLHARACETILSEYYNAISRAGDDPDVVARLRTSMRTQRFGLFLGFRSGYGPAEWWNARPTLLYRTFYLSMVGAAALIAAIVWSGIWAAEEAKAPAHDIGHHSWNHDSDGRRHP